MSVSSGSSSKRRFRSDEELSQASTKPGSKGGLPDAIRDDSSVVSFFPSESAASAPTTIFSEPRDVMSEVVDIVSQFSRHSLSPVEEDGFSSVSRFSRRSLSPVEEDGFFSVSPSSAAPPATSY